MFSRDIARPVFRAEGGGKRRCAAILGRTTAIISATPHRWTALWQHRCSDLRRAGRARRGLHGTLTSVQKRFDVTVPEVHSEATRRRRVSIRGAPTPASSRSYDAPRADHSFDRTQHGAVAWVGARVNPAPTTVLARSRRVLRTVRSRARRVRRPRSAASVGCECGWSAP
jgi:hypothetical protein